MSRELKDLLMAFGLMVFGFAMGGAWLCARGDTGCEQFDTDLQAAKVEITRLRAIQAREARFQPCDVTYVSHFDGSSIQQIQLTCPDSIQVEVEK